MSRLRLLTGCLLSLYVFLLVGCQTTTGHYLGAEAESGPVVPFAQADKTQTWQDLYLVIDSHFEQQQQGGRLTGVMRYADHVQMMYVRAGRLTLRVFLLDTDNRVVAYQTVSGLFPGSTVHTSHPFAVSFADIKGAVAYTFGYEATFIDDEGMAFQVWNQPRTSR